MAQVDMYTNIVDMYLETKSVKKTAEIVGASIVKVRRVLITEGLWSSPTSRKIGELLEQGLSTAEIAEQLHYTEKNIQAFMPYTKGLYGRDTANSVSSKIYRERNQKAADGQVGSGSANRDFARTETATSVSSTYGMRPIALQLHLELDTYDLTSKEASILSKYGKVDKSISRDIIIPADMTLHALHYVIQRLFGWQNSHLHHFAFPDDVFQRVTENRFKRWCSLCGIYFRFPDEELDDLFWDDDYDGSESIKSWMKRKYTGPYFYGGLGDYYFENQQMVKMLKRDVPILKVLSRKKAASRSVPIDEATIEEFQDSIMLSGGMNHLLERLTVMEYVYIPDNDYFLDSVDENIRFLEDGLDQILPKWAGILADIDNNFDAFCDYALLSTVRMQAQSHQLEYYYDYGDDWKVTISCTRAFYAENMDVAETEQLETVLSKHAPVCIQSDGLPVVEDVGGIGGYIDFLATAYMHPDSEEREEAREWARLSGWTGRNASPRTML